MWVEVPVEGEPFDVVNNVGSCLFAGGYGGDRGFLEADRGQYDAAADVFAWCGGGVLLRRSYLDDVGLFDERFFLYYEDSDLSWRGQLRGWRYLYVPGSVIRHRHAASSGGPASAVFQFHVQRNRLLMLIKNAPARVAARAVAVWSRESVSVALRDVVRPALRSAATAARPHQAAVAGGTQPPRIDAGDARRPSPGRARRATGERHELGDRQGGHGVSAAPRSRRIAVYDLHWRTIGGGEQVAGAAVEALVAAGHEVTMLGPEPVDPQFLLERLGVDVSGAAFRVVDAELGAAAASADYDAFVNVTYRSTAPNHADHGLYYVHFPEPPRSPAAAAGDVVGRFTIGAVDRTPLRRVRPVAVARDEVALRTRQHGYVSTYDCFAGNSRFTNGWIERLWGVTPELLYPPVQPVVPVVPELRPGSARRSTIVSVGRFFDARHGHGKKQLELVEAFRSLVRSGRADGWELILIGGCDAANRDYLLEVRRAAIGLPVSVLANAPGALRQEVVGSASVYWHAAGFGEDPQRHPERFEHFGIAIVEAMSAGAVPVVFDAAGPAEIVEDGASGRRWATIEELVEMTAELIEDPAARARLSAAAVRRSMDFSKDAFAERLLAIVGAWWA